MAKRKSKAGFLGISNTTLLLIGGGVALYYLTRPKTENRTIGAIGSTTGKKVFVVYGSEDGILGVFTNIKYAYERALDYIKGYNNNYTPDISYNQVTKKFNVDNNSFVTIYRKESSYGSVYINLHYLNMMY
jgi:hypothetical protein